MIHRIFPRKHHPNLVPSAWTDWRSSLPLANCFSWSNRKLQTLTKIIQKQNNNNKCNTKQVMRRWVNSRLRWHRKSRVRVSRSCYPERRKAVTKRIETVKVKCGSHSSAWWQVINIIASSIVTVIRMMMWTILLNLNLQGRNRSRSNLRPISLILPWTYHHKSKVSMGSNNLEMEHNHKYNRQRIYRACLQRFEWNDRLRMMDENFNINKTHIDKNTWKIYLLICGH